MPPPFLIIDYILVMGGTGQVYMRESRAYGAGVTIFGRARLGGAKVGYVPTGGTFGAGLAGKNKGAGPCRGLGCRVSGQVAIL